MNDRTLNKFLWYSIFFIAAILFFVFVFRAASESVPLNDSALMTGILLIVVSFLVLTTFILIAILGQRRLSGVFLDFVIRRFRFIPLVTATFMSGIICLVVHYVFAEPTITALTVRYFFSILCIPLIIPPFIVVTTILWMCSPENFFTQLSRDTQHLLTDAFHREDYSAEKKKHIVLNIRNISKSISTLMRDGDSPQYGFQAMKEILDHYLSYKDPSIRSWFYIESALFPGRTEEELEAIIQARVWFEVLLLDVCNRSLAQFETDTFLRNEPYLFQFPAILLESAIRKKDGALLDTLLYFYQNHLIKYGLRISDRNSSERIFLFTLERFSHLVPNLVRNAPSIMHEKVEEMLECVFKEIRQSAPLEICGKTIQVLRQFNEECAHFDALNKEKYLEKFFQLLPLIDNSSESKNVKRPFLKLIIAELMKLQQFYMAENDQHLMKFFENNMRLSPYREILVSFQIQEQKEAR